MKRGKNVARDLADYDSTIFERLQQAVQEGRPEEEFPVGMEILDTWTDVSTQEVYDAPWVIVGYRDVMNGALGHHLAAILLRRRVILDVIDLCKEKIVWSSNFRITNDIDEAYRGGCSLAVLRVAQPVAVKYSPAVVTFFLPDAEDLHAGIHETRDSHAVVRYDLLGEDAWDYFRDAPLNYKKSCSKRAILGLDGKTNQRYWLSTVPYQQSDGGFGCGSQLAQVQVDGSVRFASVNTMKGGHCGFVMACAIY